MWDEKLGRKGCPWFSVSAGVFCLIVAGCGHVVTREADTTVHDRALRLAHAYGIVDTHIDVPERLHEKPANIAVRSTEGDFDFERAREGGLSVAFMSIYTASALEGTGRSKPLADTLIDMVEGFARQWPEKFAVVKSVADVGRLSGSGRVLLAMGMENGSPLEGSLENLQHFYDRGVRYITLAHAKWNHLSDGSFDTVRHWNGLSPFGRQVIDSMNRLGIMIDVSHLTDSAFYQIMRLSRAPVIASHSSCRYFTPGFERNIDDPMIKQLAAAGGVVQINFGSFFLTEEANRQDIEREKRYQAYLAEHHLVPDDSLSQWFKAQDRKDHPPQPVTVADVANHIDHVVQIAGIDHVGIGSDFDGVEDLPGGLTNVAEYPNLLEELLKRGYTDEMIGKICSGNILRVWAAVERVAQQEGHR